LVGSSRPGDQAGEEALGQIVPVGTLDLLVVLVFPLRSVVFEASTIDPSARVRSIHRRIAALTIVGAVAIVPVAACGSSPPKSGASAAPTDLGDIVDLSGKTEVSIDVIDNTFTPKAFKVSPGTKVTFVNRGVNVHNVTPAHDGDFVALHLDQGASGVVIAPQNAETFGFFCTIHGGASSGQRGAFIVTRPSS
jgi:plastocyanin